ncbi:ankyrin repeat domain-containing protein [Candidatus Neptunochlamydia vexilliferae]|uniref:Uncharacterized protein n=1 Tax=Candidatus Neptunichlamydia vexilliferae TaxID=1651774 RepID=A0ABS0AY66_9BACT|nr:ankyrin repeat domain-containing protein [Candidatus Neptunochlamydia vexilliferae]MBF5059066.1 hypothetical protein [Candidatus Neptunochlamydia vexilliferae]
MSSTSSSSSNSSSSSTSNLAINMDALRNYYAKQENPLIDEMESGSITPRAVVKNPSINGTKEYQPVCEAGANPYRVTRYTIERSPNYKTKEQDVFKKALAHLMDKNIPPYGTSDAKNVILVDVFVWEKGSVKLEQNKPEFHTVCLCKKSDNTLILIDPSDIMKTSKQIKEIVKGVSPSTQVEPIKFSSRNPKEVKFYAPPNGTIRTADVGRKEGERRDCIDVAVKIAFVLIEAQKGGKNLTAAINEVSHLSNQDINTRLKMRGSAAKGTLIRGLQCSNRAIRSTVISLFEKSTDIYKHVAPLNHKDLEVIHDERKKYLETISSLSVSLKSVGRVSLRALRKMVDLHRILEEFNRETLFGASIKIDSAIDIESCITDRDFNRTDLHLAIIEKKGSVKDVLKKYGNLKKPQASKLIGWADIHGQTALHWAVDRAPTEECKLLYDSMTPDQICYQMNDRLQTALHFAVHANRPEIVKLLLSRNDVKKSLVGPRDVLGQTALYWAVHKAPLEVCNLLYELMTPEQICYPMNCDLYTALHFAVHANRPEIVKLLLSRDDVKERLVGIRDTHGQTALHWAVDKAPLEVCNLLYELMTPEQICYPMNDRLHTVLHLAAHANRPEIVKLLLSNNSVKGGLIGLKDYNNETALDWAKHEGQKFEGICNILNGN